MPTYGARIGQSDGSLMPLTTPTFSVRFQPCNCYGLCWEIGDGPTTFHTITARDANIWCQKWLVWSAFRAPITPNFSIWFSTWNWWGLCWEVDVGPPLFTLFLQPKMLTNDVRIDRCDQPIMPWSHQNFSLVPVVKLLDERLITPPSSETIRPHLRLQ